MRRSLKLLLRSAQNALIELDQRECSGDRYAMLENRIINVILALPVAALCASVCWSVIDMLVPAVVATDYHFGAIWAASQRVSELSGVVDHCDLESTLTFRFRLLTMLSFLFVCLGTGQDFRQWIVSGTRPKLVALDQRCRWLFLIYALIVAVSVARQPISHARPAEKSWCDTRF